MSQDYRLVIPMTFQNAFIRIIDFVSTPSQHIMREMVALAVQDCIIEQKYTLVGGNYLVKVEYVKAKLHEYAPIMLSPVKATNNVHSYVQASAWNHNNKKSQHQRCTEYASASQQDKIKLEKDWVNTLARSVLRSQVTKNIFPEANGEFIVSKNMAKCLDVLRVPIRTLLILKCATNMISWSANFLGKKYPAAASMGSLAIASGVVWNALGLGKSAPRNTLFAKKIMTANMRPNVFCVYCPVALTAQIHMDHVMSFKHGGPSSHHAGNLVPSCRKCNGNSGKGSNYIGRGAWIRIKDFYTNNPNIVRDVKVSMARVGHGRKVTWQDWWNEVLQFYSPNLAGTVVWNPGAPAVQLTRAEISLIRQTLKSIRQM